jgi:hypothetical protein
MQIWKCKYPNIMVENYCITSYPKGEGSFPKVFPLNHFFGHHFVAKLKIKNGDFVVMCNYVKIHGLHLCKKLFIYNFIELNKWNGIFQINITITFWWGWIFARWQKISQKITLYQIFPFFQKENCQKLKKILKFCHVSSTHCSSK